MSPLPPLALSALIVVVLSVSADPAGAEPNAVIGSKAFSSATGDCLTITESNVVVEGVDVGPCKGVGINILGSNVTVLNSRIHDTAGVGVLVNESRYVQVYNSVFTRNATGVYAVNAKYVRVTRNTFNQMLGPMPRGQCVQFNNVTGGSSSITDNECGSAVSDGINVFQSSGTVSSPIQISGNNINTASVLRSTGGITLGDNGGSYQIATGNKIANSGGVGMCVAGGTYISVIGNTMTSPQLPWSNVGLCVWEQGGGPCNNITLRNNMINWVNSEGFTNNYWNVGNCGPLLQ